MTEQNRWLDYFLDFIGHLSIDSKETGITKLGDNLYGAQIRFLEEICSGLDAGVRHFTVLKARQLGISTVGLAMDLFWLLVHPGTQGALITDTDGNSRRFNIILRRYIESIPKNIMGNIKVEKHNDRSLVLSNGSVLDYLVAGVKKGGAGLARSRALNFVHATEMSSWGDPEAVDSLKASMAEKNPNRLYIFESPLALDTPIPTPYGWRTMGEMKEGHIVFNEEGKPCRVVGVSPVFINRKCYKITFENGDSIVSDEGHKWRVEERRWPNNPQWKTKIIPTKDLDVANHRIRLTKPLELPESPLPIDPYFLGAWLGDGLTGQTAMVAGDEDMEEMRENLVANGCNLSPVSKNNWRVGKFTVLGERSKFIRLGLIGDKHIPDAYLRASESQRRELLAGLMDTDGYINKKTFHCDFTSTSPKLLDSVSELLSSLGIKYSRSKHTMSNRVRVFPNGRSYMCSASERLNFSESPECIVFKLRRKKDIQNSDRGYTWRKGKYLKIVSIEETESVPVKCISVDTPSHLFLAGKTMIPTHNTAKGFNLFWEMWEAAKKDVHTQKAIFIGWWAKEDYSIPRTDPRFKEYWDGTITNEEETMLKLVHKDYGVDITPEQLAWYRWNGAAKITGQGMLSQEFPSYESDAFISTGQHFFPPGKISKDFQGLRSAVGKNGDGKYRDAWVPFKAYRYQFGLEFESLTLHQTMNAWEADLRVWEEPVDGAEYVMGIDPAYGRNDNKDKHSIEVYRCYADKCVQVAEFATSSPETYVATWVMAHLAGYYHKVLLNLEINGPGKTIMQEMKHLRQMMDRGVIVPGQERPQNMTQALAGAKWYLYHRPDSPGNGYVYNFQTSVNTKHPLMDQMRDAYVLDRLVVVSEPLLGEMQRIVQDGSNIEAEGGAKDDRVLATALAIEAWVKWVRPGMIEKNLTFERVQALEAKASQNPRATLVGNVIQRFYEDQAKSRKTARINSMMNVRKRR